MATDDNRGKLAALVSCVAAGAVCILSPVRGTYRPLKRKEYHQKKHALKRSFAKDKDKKHWKRSDALALDKRAFELPTPTPDDAERPAIKQQKTETLHKPANGHDSQPVITLTAPDTRNHSEFDFISHSYSPARNRTTDESGIARQGLVVPPKWSKKKHGFFHDRNAMMPSPGEEA
ncbi:Hypothetical predicted protein [Lecanosticta acicola]|uniref:Uncharacterized protein n=1 Tax=Lecanosticta acicola TaxID=111012 RepID=A0AAI9E861_9PEZI|nr:Hypothetical predicted protein [Lecanosticta acicola]